MTPPRRSGQTSRPGSVSDTIMDRFLGTSHRRLWRFRHGPAPLPPQRGLLQQDTYYQDLPLPDRLFGADEPSISASCTGGAFSAFQASIRDGDLVVSKSSSTYLEDAADEALQLLRRNGSLSPDPVEPERIIGMPILPSAAIKALHSSVQPAFLLAEPQSLNIDGLLSALNVFGRARGHGRIYGIVVLTRISRLGKDDEDRYRIDSMSSMPGIKPTDNALLYRLYTDMGEAGAKEEWKAFVPRCDSPSTTSQSTPPPSPSEALAKPWNRPLVDEQARPGAEANTELSPTSLNPSTVEVAAVSEAATQHPPSDDGLTGAETLNHPLEYKTTTESGSETVHDVQLNSTHHDYTADKVSVPQRPYLAESHQHAKSTGLSGEHATATPAAPPATTIFLHKATPPGGRSHTAPLPFGAPFHGPLHVSNPTHAYQTTTTTVPGMPLPQPPGMPFRPSQTTPPLTHGFALPHQPIVPASNLTYAASQNVPTSQVPPVTRSGRRPPKQAPAPPLTNEQRQILSLDPKEITGETIIRLAETMKTEHIKFHVDQKPEAHGGHKPDLNTYTKRITNALLKRASLQYLPNADKASQARTIAAVRDQFNQQRIANGIKVNTAAAGRVKKAAGAGSGVAIPAIPGATMSATSQVPLFGLQVPVATPQAPFTFMPAVHTQMSAALSNPVPTYPALQFTGYNANTKILLTASQPAALHNAQSSVATVHSFVTDGDGAGTK